ncbi:MAG: hypothetical protein AMQ22_00605 [Candidatus Methanofastidiosum methylothiophilum]|uniref:Uncharacterized protein n=1 Tax=Candidatus Methanofastidiosum methylothiophilum TaxID=1705564 RepID=A0A150J780_9EURY|nr:MAG: hypothetical protein AMQ22_00605 [Candidatus Methanofastidiosum methylthiophilus]
MGADFLLMWCPYPEITEKRLEELKQRIKTLNDLDINDRFEDLVDDETGETDLDAYKDLLKDIIQHFPDYEDYRECTTMIPHNSYRIILSGGMSWGDSPTNCYEDLEKICSVEKLWYLLEKYAVEDMQTHRKERDL